MYFATFFMMWIFVWESTAQDIWSNQMLTRAMSDAATGQFPHQVSVQYKRRHWCGGSIVHKRYVLTSAYCIARMTADNMTAVLGLYSLDEVGDRYQVDSIIAHEDYSPKTRLNDIALIKLKRDIVTSKSVKAISLAKKESSYSDGQTLILSGWTDYYAWPTGGWQNNMQIVQTKSMPLEQCKNRHEYSGTWGRAITDSHLCTTAGLRQNSCLGEAGSALINAEGKQLGVSSWSRPCSPNMPYVYTKITKYVNWIENNIAKGKLEIIIELP